MLERLSHIANLPAPRVRLPYAVAFGFALGAEAISRVLTHRPPRASVTEVRMSRKHMFFDSAKARRELGYSPQPVEAALAGAVEFFRKTGLARAAV